MDQQMIAAHPSLQVSKMTVNRWARGQCAPSAERLDALLMLLDGVSPRVSHVHAQQQRREDGTRMVKALVNRGYPLRQIADGLRCSVRTVIRFKKGERCPDLGTYEKLQEMMKWAPARQPREVVMDHVRKGAQGRIFRRGSVWLAKQTGYNQATVIRLLQQLETLRLIRKLDKEPGGTWRYAIN